MIAGVVLAAGAALLYGVSDYVGATAASRLHVLPTTAVIYVLATVVLAVMLLMSGGAWSSAALLWGAVAGGCAVVGFLAFYAAMASEPMSLMSALTAALQSAVPIAVAVLVGTALSSLAWVGVGLAVVASMLISIDPGSDSSPMSARSLLLALTAGISLGLSVVALDLAPHASGLIPGLTELVVGLVVLGLLAALSRAADDLKSATPRLDIADADAQRSRRTALILAGVGGVLLGGANALLILALHISNLATVSVLVSLYPIATILLAWTRRKERLSTAQVVGVALALASSAVLAMS